MKIAKKQNNNLYHVYFRGTFGTRLKGTISREDESKSWIYFNGSHSSTWNKLEFLLESEKIMLTFT